MTAEIGAGERADAKVNLALHVVGRRANGYHLIESLVAFADFGDTISAAASSRSGIALTIDGPFADTLRTTEPRSNLAVRAADALAATMDGAPATHLTLTKRLPVAAGLGGGSADAAAVLRLLNRRWDLNHGAARLAEIGAPLGADVPMCVMGLPVVARGIGERLSPVAGLPALPLVLACPPVSVSTAAVYAAFDDGRRGESMPPLPRGFASPEDVAGWLRHTRNDLSAAAAAVSPRAVEAERTLARDEDCLLARMTGSGAAAYGIYASQGAATDGANRLSAANPDWWVVAVTTRAS